MRGWALAMQGQGEEGIAQIHQGLSAYRATGAEVGRPWYLTLLSEAYGRVGEISQGLDVLAEALALMDETGERWCAAELYRVQGELTLSCADNPYEKAETGFHQALEVARSQQVKSLELRAATSLARLWQSQGKCQAAYDLLAPVYEWFTEGFGTADLKDAKGLLDELEG